MMGDMVNISKDIINNSVLQNGNASGKPVRRTRDNNMSFDIS